MVAVTQPEDVPKRKRPLWRRIVRVIVRVLAVLVVLVVLLVAFLHTSWGKSIVRSRIEAKLGDMVNGQVTLGSLDYGFLFSSVELGDLEIRDASGKPAIRVGSLKASLDRGSVIAGTPVIHELAIDGVAVTVVQAADGTSNLTGLFKPSDRKPLERITVEKIAVSGSATLTRPDGTVIAISDLGIAGTLDAQPAAKQLDLALAHLGAKVAVTQPNAPVREIEIAIDDLRVGRHAEAIDLEIKKLGVGVLGIDGLAAHANIADGHLRGAQSLTLGKIRVDSKELTKLLGKQVLLDDVAVELSVTGPEDKLAIHGTVQTRQTKLTLDGTVDASVRARPKYQLALVGNGRSVDVVAKQPGNRPVETDLRLDVKGAGASLADLEADIALVVGPTKIGTIAIDGLNAKAVAHHGAYRLSNFDAHGLGFHVAATGELLADKTVHAELTVNGSPAEAMKVLAAAGIAIPRRVPKLGKLDVEVSADGNLDGAIDVILRPTTIAIAGGDIALAGNAHIVSKKVVDASTKIAIRSLDLAAAAQLAGKEPKVHGTLSGTIDVAKTGSAKHAAYALTVALRDPSPANLAISVSGTTDLTTATASAKIMRTTDRAVLAKIDARLPLTDKGIRFDGPWKVSIDAAKRSIAEVVALLPPERRAKLADKKLPEGDVALHVELAGTPARPTGTISLTAHAAALPQGTQTLDLKASIASSARGLAITANGTATLRDGDPAIATITAKVATPPPIVGGKPDLAKLRAGASFDAAIDIPERELASLAWLRPKLADLGGTLGGKITVAGTPAAPKLDATLRWAGYGTASGSPGETTIRAHGTPTAIAAKIDHGGTLAITADIDRSNPDRVAIVAHARAAEQPLLPLLPKLAAKRLDAAPGLDLGKLRWNMDADVVLATSDTGLALDRAAITGALAVSGASFAIPHTNRKLHDISLEIVGEPGAIRLASLTAHETDLEVRDRNLAITGRIAFDRMKPKTAALHLVAKDWLVSTGTPTFGAHDAPRATAHFDIDVTADLAAPIIAIDATINDLFLDAPDRLDRGHQPEYASPGGDVIYVDGNALAGKLPYAAPAPPAAPKPRPEIAEIDARIHIPRPIRVMQIPLDVKAHGELTVTVRNDGVKMRGGLTMDSGTLSLFGGDHELVEGSLTFTDEHPSGWLSVTFDRTLPDAMMRDLAATAGGAQITLTGVPGKQKTTLHGAANGAMLEVMAMYNAGRPVYVNRPGLPASNTTQVPRGDQLFVLTFMASNLPHLLFLDRFAAWADPYAAPNSYGRIQNMEADRYRDHTRIRALVRPPTPGRSSAELQYDRLFFDDNRRQLGIGLRGGDRGGGGLGLFYEWSSND